MDARKLIVWGAGNQPWAKEVGRQHRRYTIDRQIGNISKEVCSSRLEEAAINFFKRRQADLLAADQFINQVAGSIANVYLQPRLECKNPVHRGCSTIPRLSRQPR